MSIKALLAPIALAAFLAASAAAVAAPTAYTTQASFLAAISNVGVDSFDDIGLDSLDTPLSRSAGAFTYTASVGPASIFYPASDDGSDIWLSAFTSTDTITFSNFSAGVSAVGGFFFGSDAFGLSAATASLTITATDATGTRTQVLSNASTSSFLGFVSSGALTSLTVAVNAGQDSVIPTINDLTLGTAAVTPVPEPETYALMLGGLGLLGWVARRRKT